MSTRSGVNLSFILPGILTPAASSHAQAAPTSPTRIVTPHAGDRQLAGLFAERIRFLRGDRAAAPTGTAFPRWS